MLKVPRLRFQVDVAYTTQEATHLEALTERLNRPTRVYSIDDIERGLLLRILNNGEFTLEQE